MNCLYTSVNSKYSCHYWKIIKDCEVCSKFISGISEYHVRIKWWSNFNTYFSLEIVISSDFRLIVESTSFISITSTLKINICWWIKFDFCTKTFQYLIVMACIIDKYSIAILGTFTFCKFELKSFLYLRF